MKSSILHLFQRMSRNEYYRLCSLGLHQADLRPGARSSRLQEIEASSEQYLVISMPWTIFADTL